MIKSTIYVKQAVYHLVPSVGAEKTSKSDMCVTGQSLVRELAARALAAPRDTGRVPRGGESRVSCECDQRGVSASPELRERQEVYVDQRPQRGQAVRHQVARR